MVKDFNQGVTADGTDSFLRKLKRVETDPGIPTDLAPLLKMMRSLGQYLNSKQDGIHPDTLPVLFSITEQFEDMVRNETVGRAGSADAVHGRISGEIKKYKDLQNKMTSSPSVPESDLSDLKAVILAIDWEISDQTMQQFQKTLTELITRYEPYKIHHTLLKIMQTIGQYIGSRKAGAHSESISLLNSVLESFEHICGSPEMTFRDKKKVLEDTIRRFHSLKDKISRPEPAPRPPEDLPDEEPIAPALSHLKPSVDDESEDVAPVATLSDTDLKGKIRERSDSGTTKPASVETDQSVYGPRQSDSTDVMGDLFTVKESPADELLDAIHMMDVHGADQAPPFPMPDTPPSSSGKGIRQFSPQRVDKDPLPEIETRLNAFFDLEPEEEIETVFETEPEQRPEPEAGVRPGTPFMDILTRLQSDLAGMERARDIDQSPFVRDRAFELRSLCMDDPEKSGLVDVILSLLHLLEIPETSSVPPDEPRTDEGGMDKDKTEEDRAGRKKPSGLLARIKTLFKS